MDYGEVNYKGRKIKLTECGNYHCFYGSGISEFFTDVETGKIEYYSAKGIDEDGKKVVVKWKIIADAENEEDCCNWERPDEVVEEEEE